MQENIRKHQLELQSLQQSKGDMLSYQLAQLKNRVRVNLRFLPKPCFYLFVFGRLFEFV